MNRGKRFLKNRVIASIPICWESNYRPKNNLTQVRTSSTPHKGVTGWLSKTKETRNTGYFSLSDADGSSASEPTPPSTAHPSRRSPAHPQHQEQVGPELIWALLTDQWQPWDQAPSPPSCYCPPSSVPARAVIYEGWRWQRAQRHITLQIFFPTKYLEISYI